MEGGIAQDRGRGNRLIAVRLAEQRRQVARAVNDSQDGDFGGRREFVDDEVGRNDQPAPAESVRKFV